METINRPEVAKIVKTFIKKHKNKREFFLDGNSAFDLTVEILSDYKAIPNMDEVSDLSGVSKTTLYKWVSGKVKSPRICNVEAVLAALGYELVVNVSVTRKAH